LRRGEGYQNVPEEFGFVEIEKKKYILWALYVKMCVYIYIYLWCDCCDDGNELSNTIICSAFLS